MKIVLSTGEVLFTTKIVYYHDSMGTIARFQIRGTKAIREAYNCDIEEILNDDAPTSRQERKIEDLKKEGYTWDAKHSVAAAGVVLSRGKRKAGSIAKDDFWFFGMEGEIMHNPDGITIKL